jgi:uncharacterized membrane protein SpoIIM required for sporulation
MREPVFIKRNAEKWQTFEQILSGNDNYLHPDKKAELFIELTDDLAYAKTFFPQSQITQYLNSLTAKVHRSIYRNKKADTNKFIHFWRVELPMLLYEARRFLLYSFIIFALAALIGAFSAANDDKFVRLILGDSYVNMTLENIEKGDPMGVYKQEGSSFMFLAITFNNIRVSFYAFVLGILFSVGTAWVLFSNGVMLGAFQYFFYQKGLFLTSFLTIWIHGTIEISAIILAGCAGMVMGNSITFAGTYPRSGSFVRGVQQGAKILVGLIPLFIIAGFLEGFVTRLTEMHILMKIAIIAVSAIFVVGYFVVYPVLVYKSEQAFLANISTTRLSFKDEDSFFIPAKQNAYSTESATAIISDK